MVDRPGKIFIVDDSEQDLRIHAATLRAQGYEIVTACNGEEALLRVEADVPDLFLVAAKMRDMDGFDLCERLKDDARLINVPVIFVTGIQSHLTEDFEAYLDRFKH